MLVAVSLRQVDVESIETIRETSPPFCGDLV